MSGTVSGTMRGTPSRNQGRGGAAPAPTSAPFNNTTPSPSSNIPRPVHETHPHPGHSQPAPSEAASGVSASRQKQTKRDEAIRRKLESDLSKKKHLTSRARHSRKAPPGTVLALKPSPALQIKPSTTVAEAAQLMAAKREDCVLVTDDNDRIAGIFTAKDLAFRVVGIGQKATNVTIAEIMTKNPLCARTDTSATDALDLMVRKGFRHLPVMDENQDISGVLDITKCFYDAMEKLERAYSSSTKLYAALEGVQSELGTSQPQQIIQYVEALRSKMSGPTLESVLNGMPPTTVSVRTSVKEAAMLMKENHTTAVLVQDQGQITGIFTSKDVVLRVIAPGLDPGNCSVVRVMTPHPDFAPMDMSIQAALRKMHDGHYLNLPVMNDQGEIVGMVDVLKLTYATLEQINTMSSGDSEGPAWNKFWLSLDNETESMVSGEGSHHHQGTVASRSMMSPDANRERITDSVAPGDSASHVGLDASPQHSMLAEQSPADVPFAFKFKAPSGRVHRLQVIASQGIEHFVEIVVSKLGNEVEAIGGAPEVEDGQLSPGGFAMSYLDDEGDSVSITTDQDLIEAVLLARHHHHEKVDLFVHDPEKPPVAATAPAPESAIPTPPASAVPSNMRRRRTAQEDDEDDDSEEDDFATVRHRKRTHSHAAEPEQVIAGVPNELLLPGAIVTLAFVIVGVFAISRVSSR
ncbi:CBS and PB1 domain-containing protein [Whalleya microplaca]|nr:CBS and PB1 domain-containing protein [Whalleya microplaca]